MVACLYTIENANAIALAVATPKTILNVRSSGAAFGISLRGFTIGFDGVNAANVPVLVELCATSAGGVAGPGSPLVRQVGGRVIAHGTAGNFQDATGEPGLTVLKEYILTPNGGSLDIKFPPDKSFDCDNGDGFGIRCTAPAIVNVWATMEFERT